MKTLTIKSKYDSTQIYEELLDQLDDSSMEINLKDNHIIFNISDNERKYKDFLSHKIATHIIENVQPRMVREEIMIEFSSYLDDSVEELIKKITWKLIYKDEEAMEQHILSLTNQIKDFFIKDNYLNLDGFAKFRLNDKKNEIQDLISDELNRILDEEEFESFITIMKQFIAIKIPQNELVHFVMIKDGDFEFITGNRKRIDLNEVNTVCDELENSSEYKIETKDFVLGVLTTLAPKNIVIHTNHKQDPQIAYMLNRIYGPRASECQGCEFCESIRTTRNIKKS